MRMPFGKYEGRHIHETPRYYRRWALETLDISGDLKKAMQMGLEKKEWNPPPHQDLDKLMEEICYAWGD
jgi:uncharacterized protein (DUF3820 family)